MGEGEPACQSYASRREVRRGRRDAARLCVRTERQRSGPEAGGMGSRGQEGGMEREEEQVSGVDCTQYGIEKEGEEEREREMGRG